MFKRDYNFKEVDGVRIAVTAFWRPMTAETGLQTYGIALGFHGGGFVIGSRHMIPEVEIDYLCNRHYVVVSADYRLCPQAALSDIIQDAIDAFSWCKSVLPTKLRHDVGIEVDSARIVAFGQSAGSLLALHLGTLPETPRAILDFYGVKYLDDQFWHSPLPALANLPQFEQSFLGKIYEEPILTTTATSLERVAARPASTVGQAKKRGIPAPDLSVPRNAWLFTALKNGTQISTITQSDTFETVEPTLAFKPGFPPTAIIHGDADSMVPCRLSERAYRELSNHDVKTDLFVVPNQDHGFDTGLSSDDSEWQQVRRALDFLVVNGNK